MRERRLRPSAPNYEVDADSDQGVRHVAQIAPESARFEPNFSVARAPAQTTTARADTVAVKGIGRGWLAAIIVVAIVVVMAGTVRLSFCDGPVRWVC